MRMISSFRLSSSDYGRQSPEMQMVLVVTLRAYIPISYRFWSTHSYVENWYHPKMTYITYIYRRRHVGTGMIGRVNRRNPQIEMPTAKNSVNFRTRPNCTKIGIQTNSTPPVIFYLRRNEKFGLLHVQTGIETLSESISRSISGIRTWLLVGSNRLVIVLV